MTSLHLQSTALLDDAFPLPVDRPFSLRQARDAGLTRHRIRMLERFSLLRRVIKSVYVAVQVPDSITLRAQALQLVVPKHTVVTDWTACWFFTGVLPPNQHLTVPELRVFRPAGHDRLRNDLCTSGERSFATDDLVVVAGLTLTSPLRTAWDLGRLAHRDSAIAALDALLRHGTFTSEQLCAGVERFKGMRGVIQLRQLAPLADARSESWGESVLKLRWRDLPSLPPPTPQVSVSVAGVEIYRIDLGVPELRYACEYDGEEFHGPDEQSRDEARRDDLYRRFGWDVDVARRINVFGVKRDVERMLYDGIDRARRSMSRRAG